MHAIDACTLHLPCAIGDYTDFYAGIHHATNVGRLFRPDQPLMPNYKYVPIAYHGRASSVRVSGAAVRRPNGQRKPATETEPSFGPCRNLDYELELGVWIGPGNAPGEPITIGNAADHIAGFCLLNDWSARDIQGWEYQPLGPFLAKNFCTTISPWIIMPEALAPYRCPAMPRPAGDPAPLDYLSDAADQAGGGLDLSLGATLSTAALRQAGHAPHTLTQGNARDLYWTVAQMVAHHTANGCDLRPGGFVRLRHHLRRGGGVARQPAGDHRRRPSAGGAAKRRAAALPGGWRRTGPVRPVRQRRVRPLHRPRHRVSGLTAWRGAARVGRNRGRQPWR